jgi:hypothetical protein
MERNPGMVKERKKHVTIMIVVAIIALVIRIVAALDAYPCCGDAGHFVQHGTALAHGIPGAMSTYWSQGMILISAMAEMYQFDPRLIMQFTTVITGTAVAVLLASIMLRMTGSLLVSLVFGCFCATSPTFVQYSINGYSESPYLAFLLFGIRIGLCRSKSSKGTVFRLITAGAMIGVAGYFKGLDAAVAAIAFGLYLVYSDFRAVRRWVAKPFLVPLAAFIVLLPLCLFTYQRTGSFTPGNKGAANFYLGEDWNDSTICYAATHSEGGRDFASALQSLPRRVAINAAEMFRIFNRHFFMKGFRLGTVWFFLLVTGSIIVVYAWARELLLLPLFMLSLQLFLMSLVFVHSRILFPSFVWVAFVLMLAVCSLFFRISTRLRTVFAAIVVLFLSLNGVYALFSFRHEFVYWRYDNIIETAERMKQYADDSDVIMTYGPHLSVEFYTHNPLLGVEMPYGSFADVESVAHEANARFLVVSDVFRGHWPISGVFDKTSVLPENWRIVDIVSFEDESGDYRYPTEHICIIERVSFDGEKQSR